ncbi:MAG: S8 family serine peptidase [Desulfosalsimonadaceae bacterium]
MRSFSKGRSEMRKTGRFRPVTAVFLLFFIAAACGGGGGGGDDNGDGEPFTFSGTVTAASNSAIDSDVNDPNAPYSPNNTVETAQTLLPPATLGGYVNQPKTGETGRSYTAGDISDVYAVDLLAGEQAVLNIAEPYLNAEAEACADLDLYLYDQTGSNLLGASLGVATRTENLSAPASGKYLLQVYPESGASNYTLTIGGRQDAEKYSSLRLSRDFVTQEAIVKFTDTSAAKANQAESLAALGLEKKSGGPGRACLYKTKGGQAENIRIQSENNGLGKNPLLRHACSDSQIRDKLQTLRTIKNLRSRRDIAAAEPNYIRTGFKTPNDPYYSLQWHYPLIDLPKAWDTATGSADITAAVVDTGVIMDHPDLAANISKESYDFISDPTRALDGDGIDPDADDPGDQSQGGSTFHGTHVAGTIAADSANSAGTAGVCWNSRILAIRVLGKNTAGTSYDIMQGIRYAAGLENDSGTTPSAPADIINLSLGGSSFSQTEQAVYSMAGDAGCIIVAAAGNEGENAPTYPAGYEDIISVSAVDINSKIAPYSNSDASVDVAAPGGDFSTDLNADGYVDGIFSTCGDDSGGGIQNTYTFFQGTSMAAAHVTGVAALMKSVRPRMTPDELDAWIAEGAIVRDLGSPGRDDLYGHGLIDAALAVRTAREGELTTVLSVSPASLNLGTEISKTGLAASRIGPGSVKVKSVSSDADWLRVSASDTDENGLGSYTVEAERQELSDGIYKGVISFVSSENTVEVTVQMRVRRQAGAATDAGLLYIILVDNSTDETVDQVRVEPGQGSYPYGFSEIEAGSYRIYAGTDSDNDGLIGDGGEAMGAYISMDKPVVIEAESDRAGLDFIAEFNVSIAEGGFAAAVPKLREGGTGNLKEVERR